ncbi:MAG: type VI secretion system tip protein VgrG [Lewinella sp.]|nr:type VI secretion system tip protein VgrG [Lewinella sp.]
MPGDRLIPTPVAPTVATFTVLSDGTEVSREHQILSLVIDKSVNRIPAATLVIRDGDAANQTFAVSETDLFIPGKEIEIKAGYQGTEDTVFKGMVISQSLKVREQKSVLIVKCRDQAFRMTLSPRNRYFREMTDSDVLEAVLDEIGLDKDIEATTDERQEVVQYNCTDWDFVLTRADAIGKICLVEDGKISIAKPDLLQEVALHLEFGASILDFDAELDARTQFKSVQSLGWSGADQEVLEATEDSFRAPDASNLSSEDLADVHTIDPLRQQHSGAVKEVELQQWAAARLQKSRLAKIRGRAKFQGIATVLPGRIVELAGVGDRFNGKVFVSGIRHELAAGNWVTNVEFGLDDQWFVERYRVRQPPAGGLIPPITGLHIGIVTQLENDPLGEDRVMVRLPLIDQQDEGSWARVAAMDAGENRGSFFRPEIGDEVVLGFLQDDPRNPIILGMLNSSAKPAPITASDDNHEKGFVTRSGTKLVFNDEHNNVLVETPDGNLIHVSGEDQAITLADQHGNKIVMDSSGITLESNKDITLKAAGNLLGEGVDVTMKGQGTAEFSAGGTNTIKGGIVQIN